MVTLELLSKVESPGRPLNDTVNRQLAEIVAAEIVEAAAEPVRQAAPGTFSWAYSIPFAGVRYYSYGK